MIGNSTYIGCLYACRKASLYADIGVGLLLYPWNWRCEKPEDWIKQIQSPHLFCACLLTFCSEIEEHKKNFIMKSFKRVCVTLIALFYCSVMLAGELQDVVYLKNGSIVRGLIIEQIPNESLKIQTSDGSVFVYEFSQIQKLAKEEEYPNSRSHANRYDRKTFDSFSNTVDRVGYRGFFDIGGSVGVGDFGDGVFSASTSHGYQFNPYFFLGAGLGVDYHFAYETIFMPIFADIRGYFIDGRITPFIGVKIGYSPLDGYGLYFNPTLGVSFGVSKKCALNLSIGYNMQRTEMYSDFYYYTNSPNESISGLSFKLGVEF